MANLAGFDASKVEPRGTYEAIPAGEYQVVITESTMKPTKNGGGQYLQIKLQVVDGPAKSRVLFDRLNLVNSNDMAVQIAKATLSAICRAVNVLTPKDSAELHNKPMTAIVKCVKDDEGNLRNEVSGYKPRQAQAAPARQASQKNMIQEAFEPDGEEDLVSPF